MSTEIKNAIIRSTTLGVQEHGILTCMLDLNFGGFSHGFGGWAFDWWDPERSANVGNVQCAEFIRHLLEAVEVALWEKLPGTTVRARLQDGRVSAIGHIIKEQWFTPATDLTRMTP